MIVEQNFPLQPYNSFGIVARAQQLVRVRSEYLEMPGLSLTQVQAQRLWGLEAKTCGAVLDALVQAGFLRRTAGGGYIRADIA